MLTVWSRAGANTASSQDGLLEVTLERAIEMFFEPETTDEGVMKHTTLEKLPRVLVVHVRSTRAGSACAL
eukprot:COSAG01_NODE_37016_length_509_cov_1.975610_2_plen_69_part_01